MPICEPFEPQTVLEKRYGVISLMREGENTRVYQGHHISIGLPVVIKQLKQLYPDPRQAAEQIEQYQMEVRLLAHLAHPSLVRVYDAFVNEGVPILVTEMVEGRNLAEISALAPKPISERRVLQWAEQMLQALDYLHTQDPPIIVRGLKPSNIILDAHGQLRLIDFGLAKAMDRRGAGTMDIARGVGENGYAAIEQTAYSKTDARTDLYALGAVLYFLLTKTVPPAASSRLVANSDPLSPPAALGVEVTKKTWAAISKLMSLRQSERPESALAAFELFTFEGRARAFETSQLNESVRHCVDCRVPLNSVMRSGVEIDVCQSCDGIWLDGGELDSLLERHQAEQDLAEEAVRTVAIDPSHPAIQALKEETEASHGRQFWAKLAKLFRKP